MIIIPGFECLIVSFVSVFTVSNLFILAKKLIVKNPYGSAVYQLSEAYYDYGLVNRIKHHSQYMALVKLFSLDKKKLIKYNKTSAMVKILSWFFIVHYISLYKKIKNEFGGEQ